MKSVDLLVIVILLFLCSTAHADRTVWYVHPDSTLNSIQAGIDSCITGDIVLVGPGTYVENINFNGKAITVTSELGPDTSIIDGGSPANPDSASVVSFVSGEDTTSVLHGFTITNGSGTDVPPWGYLGGGIFCDGSSSPTIMGNIITNNSAVVAAGGVECQFSSNAIIVNNVITHNDANIGGGIECYYASPRIHSNTIDSNTAKFGGGIACDPGCSSDVTDNVIRWNIAGLVAGGIDCDSCSPNIIGNTITGNIAGLGGGIRCYRASPNIKHNVITEDTALGGYGGGGIRCQHYSDPSIDSCTISNNSGDGIYCTTSADAEIHYCNITDNVGYGVYNTSSLITVDAENNWWGHATGPYHPTTNPGGLGDTVSDYVDFDPWLTDSVEWVGVEEHKPTRPVTIVLQVFPNPFHEITDIRYEIGDSDNMKLRIYDISGRLVKDFSRQLSVIGYQPSVKWDGTDDSNRKLPSGVYFLEFSAGHYKETKKLILLR